MGAGGKSRHCYLRNRYRISSISPTRTPSVMKATDVSFTVARITKRCLSAVSNLTAFHQGIGRQPSSSSPSHSMRPYPKSQAYCR